MISKEIYYLLRILKYPFDALKSVDVNSIASFFRKPFNCVFVSSMATLLVLISLFFANKRGMNIPIWIYLAIVLTNIFLLYYSFWVSGYFDEDYKEYVNRSLDKIETTKK